MAIKNKIFALIFLISLSLFIYFLGITITGHMAYIEQTMHCTDEGCFPICSSNLDCQISGFICCEENGFGICKRISDCGNQFEYSTNHLRHTAQDTSTVLFLMIVLLILMIGILYYFLKENKRSIKKTKKKKP